MKLFVWGSDEEAKRSNFRDRLCSVVSLEEEAVSSPLDWAEILLFKDNSFQRVRPLQGIIKLLHSLILCICHLEIRWSSSALIHVWEMNDCASTNCYSRGMLLEGVMIGKGMFEFADLAISVCEWCPSVLDRVQYGCLECDVTPLMPEEWCDWDS